MTTNTPSQPAPGSSPVAQPPSLWERIKNTAASLWNGWITFLKNFPSRLQTLVGYLKTYLQYAIGFGIIALLFVKILYRLFPDEVLPYLNDTLIDWFDLKTLHIVSLGLAYSAGVDLAAMLFTEGPDEAVEPLILGLASAILFSISKIDEPKLDLAWEILLYVVILGGLFLLKEIFINPDEVDSQNNVIRKRTPLRKFVKKWLKLRYP